VVDDPKIKDSIGKVIKYACISGAIEPNEYSINSKYKRDCQGVIRVINEIEHCRRWIETEKLNLWNFLKKELF
jgi:hypothetical protein